MSELNLFLFEFYFSVSIPLHVVFRLRRIFRQKQFLPLGLFRRTPSLLLAAGLTLFLTFLVGEAVPNTLFQILEIIEILLIGDPDTGFLQALVLVETIDGLRERLQTQVARLVDQPVTCASPMKLETLLLTACLLSMM